MINSVYIFKNFCNNTLNGGIILIGICFLILVYEKINMKKEKEKHREKDDCVNVIPPISREEEEKMMLLANSDIDDAQRVFNGESAIFVRNEFDRDFLGFCKELREIKNIFGFRKGKNGDSWG